MVLKRLSMLDHFCGWIPPSYCHKLPKWRKGFPGPQGKRLVEFGAYCGGMHPADAVQPSGWSRWGKGGPILVKERFSLTAVVIRALRWWPFPVLLLTIRPMDLGKKRAYLDCQHLLDWNSGKPWLRSPYPARLEDVLLLCCSSSLGYLTIPTFLFMKFRDLMVGSYIFSRDYVYTLWARARKAIPRSCCLDLKSGILFASQHSTFIIYIPSAFME